MRYITGSRMFRFFEAISILARRVREPSGNSPARMRSNRPRFSSMDRLRQGLSLPGSVKVPRYSRTWSPVRSQAYALPDLISFAAHSYNWSKEHDPAVLDVEQWADYWASLKVDAVMVSVTGILAFYQTKVPYHRKGKFLGN